jgi:thiol peroxidase
MIDFIKKSMLTGLGLAYMTKEKIAETAKDLSENAKMSEEEGRKLYDYLVEESVKTRQDFEEKVSKAVNTAADKLPFNRRVDDLASRVEKVVDVPTAAAGSADRTGVITFKGALLTLQGTPVEVGDDAPDFTAVDTGLQPVKLSDYAGKAVIISSVPSLDTPVCEMQTKRFNEEAADLDVAVLSISVDLPFAAKRFCTANDIENVVTASDYQDREFGNAYGVLIKELKVLARAVFVVDADGKIAYAEIVSEVVEQPDYDAVLAAVRAL